MFNFFSEGVKITVLYANEDALVSQNQDSLLMPVDFTFNFYKFMLILYDFKMNILTRIVHTQHRLINAQITKTWEIFIKSQSEWIKLNMEMVFPFHKITLNYNSSYLSFPFI